MLHLFRNRLRVGLSSERVVVRHTKPGIGRAAVDTRLHVESGGVSIPSWEKSLAVLRHYCQQLVGTSELELVLSNEFVRYQLLPAQQDISGFSEEQAYVRFKFREIYGDTVDSWIFSWGPGFGIEPQVVAAIDRPLMDQLNLLCEEFNIRLISVQPYLMTLFNRIDEHSIDFMVYENGRICSGAVRNGKWMSLSTAKAVDFYNDLPKHVERYHLLTECSDGDFPLHLYAPSIIDAGRLSSRKKVLPVLLGLDELVCGKSVDISVNGAAS